MSHSISVYTGRENLATVEEVRRIALAEQRPIGDVVHEAMRTWCRLRHTIAEVQPFADAHDILVTDLIHLAVQQYLTMHQEP